jgi:hypothetical protein
MAEYHMTQFVLGFLFAPDGKQVVLVRKKHPDNLAGKPNGVGDHSVPAKANPPDLLNTSFP